MFETFESRVLMANTISPVTAKLSRTGTLFITGTDAAEKILINQSAGGGVAIHINNTVPTLVGRYGLTSRIKQDRYKPLFDLNLVKRIVINAAGGNDEVFLNVERSITFNVSGGAGNDLIKGEIARSRVSGEAGDDTIDLESNQHIDVDEGVTRSIFANRAETGSITSVAPTRITPSRGVLNASGNRIDGGDGNDTIYTRGAEDSLYGGGGDDRVVKFNDFDSYFTDLPALATASNTNDAPSRAAIFSVESVVSMSSVASSGGIAILTSGMPDTIVVRRHTIDALKP